MVRERNSRFCCPMVALAACLAVAGCGGGSESSTSPERPLRIDTIFFAMQEEENQNWPAQVALVRVTDVDLVPELMRIKPASWFGGEGVAFRNAHPEGFYNDWEVVPGVDVGPDKIEIDEDVAGVLFCNTRKETPPIRLELDGDVRVLLGDDGCEPQGGEPSEEPSVAENVWDSVADPAESLVESLYEQLQGILGGE